MTTNLQDTLASLKWHITENTVNKEVILDLIDQAQKQASRAQVITTGEGFQKRVVPWLRATFTPHHIRDIHTRVFRFIEEALELAQALGVSEYSMHTIVRYVFSRDKGEKHQELGGTMVTLAALANAIEEDMHEAGETELMRCWSKREAIRAKQDAKPEFSSLPGGDPTAFADGMAERLRQHYEANKPGYWEARKRRWRVTADNLMLGLLSVAWGSEPDDWPRS